MRATEQTSQYLDRLGTVLRRPHVVMAVAAVAVKSSGFDDEARAYDAVLVVSFGGPEGPEAEVMPFPGSTCIAGRPVPPPVKARIAERYAAVRRRQPHQCPHARVHRGARRPELATPRDPDLPVYWGNRNSASVAQGRCDARQMAADGVRNALAFVTSMFSSYSGCRQYREDLFRAAEEACRTRPGSHKLRVCLQPSRLHCRDGGTTAVR